MEYYCNFGLVFKNPHDIFIHSTSFFMSVAYCKFPLAITVKSNNNKKTQLP